MIDTTTDFAAAMDDFGVTAVIGGVDVQGIFDKDYLDAYGVAGTVPIFTCKTADVSAVVPGTTTLSIGAASYLVVVVESDGTGMSRLKLEAP